MTLTECTVRSCPIDLMSTNHLRIMTIAPEIGHRLCLEVFSFVVGVKTQPIREGESLSCDRDGYLGRWCECSAWHKRSVPSPHRANPVPEPRPMPGRRSRYSRDGMEDLQQKTLKRSCHQAIAGSCVTH